VLQNFTYQAASGGAYAIRVIGLSGSQAGQVFDFAGDDFAAIGGATTPYLAAMELTGIAGTGQSIYTVPLNLALINPTLAPNWYQVAWYPGAPPNTAQNPVKLENVIIVQNGNLGPRALTVMLEQNVESTLGDKVDFSVWLEDGGQVVPIDTIDTNCTGSIVVRQFKSGANAFTIPLVVGNVINHCFEVQYNPTPGTAVYTDDRQYEALASVTCLGVTIVSKTQRVVIG
jgi:hypothetical protein